MGLNNTREFFEKILFEVFHNKVVVKEIKHASGGCINNAAKLITSAGNYFLKWNRPQKTNMFEAEAKGLQILHSAKAIKIPEVFGYGSVDGYDFLVLENIDSSTGMKRFWETFGEQLANLHHSSADSYGLDHDNFMGSLPQENKWNNDWISFFINCRLEPQLQLALKNNLVKGSFAAKYQNFYKRLSQLLVVEKPSLLHGDLWSGNYMKDSSGAPCLIDPAVYYGCREADLAMTTLFGGFEDPFYLSYQQAFPMEHGYKERFLIYNIYPLMVHVNLFGTSYLSGVERTINRFS